MTDTQPPISNQHTNDGLIKPEITPHNFSSRKYIIIIIVLIFLLLLSVFAAAYFYIQANKTNPPLRIFSDTVPAPSQITPTESEAKWKSVSLKDNINFKIPANWTQHSASEASNVLAAYESTQGGVFSVLYAPQELNLHCQEKLSEKPTQIGTLDATLWITRYVDTEGCDPETNLETSRLIFEYQNKNYNVTYSYAPEGAEKQRELFGQILATFEFVSQASTATDLDEKNMDQVNRGNEISLQVPSNFQRLYHPLLNISLCLPPKWEFAKNGDGSISPTLIFKRDESYQPDVTFFQENPLYTDSLEEAYYDLWQDEYPDVRSVAKETIFLNGHQVLKFAGPGAETIVWEAAGKMWEASISDWPYVNSSKEEFLEDFYTMISCSFE